MGRRVGRPLTRAEVSARFYQRHREERLAYAREYRAKNRPWLTERMKEYQREYAKAHREQHRAADRKWREKNRPIRNAELAEKRRKQAEAKARNLEMIRAIAMRRSPGQHEQQRREANSKR
jgi:hypothetical protein